MSATGQGEKYSGRAGQDTPTGSMKNGIKEASRTTKSLGLRCPFSTDIYAPSGTATPDPKIVEHELPTFIESGPHHQITQVQDDLQTFLSRDLDVKRLNAIHKHMWMCGRPLKARPLHRQQMLGRTISITQQCDLHLLHQSTTLFVKPLPAYLLSPAIWTSFFNHSKDHHEEACGFLLSYVWLLRTPVDFRIAQREDLLPPDLDWSMWRTLVSEILSSVDANSLHQVNKRYHFGELRLHRINSVYRLSPSFIGTHFVRGYLYGYNRYTRFFKRSVSWVLVVFVWFSLILSAMQVGISVPQLQGNRSFGDASYGFVVFSIVLVAALVAFVGGVFGIVFFYNMIAAICHARNTSIWRARAAAGGKES